MNTTDNYQKRSAIFAGIIIAIGIIYVVQLFLIQVSENQYKISAENNSTRVETIYPARGLIYDRNGELLVANAPMYDLIIIPRQLEPFDTTELCRIIQLEKEVLKERIEKAERYSYYQPSVIIRQLSAKTHAVLQEKLYKYRGFYARARTQRLYRQNTAAHLLGYVGETNKQTIDTSEYYEMGDYIGKTGIEKQYERVLRGKKGRRVYLVDVHGRRQEVYKEGDYNITAEAGKDITATIDAGLQQYGERLMQGKKGSIVALEPSTGEILALVSVPAYKPSLLVGRQRGKNFTRLTKDTLNPLFNRALMAMYPPGSTFKVANALVGLQEQVITPSSSFRCQYGYHVGSFTVGCHHNKSMQLEEAIQLSCNAYFCNVFRRILDNPAYNHITQGYNAWRDHILSIGLGKIIESDLNEQLQGILPTSDYFDRFYGEDRWHSLMLVSMGIGQGELSFTPLQMANMASVAANRGYYYPPHTVKEIEGDPSLPVEFTERHYASIDSNYFDPVVDGMEKVVQAGTATPAQLDSIVVCGKTGTAENPHGEDHSIFIAFAPKENPKIALAVYVENAGYGSVWAAPTAALMIAKYLDGSKRHKRYWEPRIMEANLIEREQQKNNASND